MSDGKRVREDYTSAYEKDISRLLLRRGEKCILELYGEPAEAVQSIIDKLVEENKGLRAEKLNRSYYCPECGSTEFEIGHNASPNERECNSCGQSWWPDVDYSDAIRKNLAERQTK